VASFLSTQPPFFSKAEEPLDADAWLHTIELKFALLIIPCADSSKAHFAAQQLRGAARIWWDNFCAMQPACHTRFIKSINRAIIYAPGSSHAYKQQNHQDITTHVTNNII
jgi:hypothetical protein